MTYRELLSSCDIVTATAERLATSEPFMCENQDLNDFFANDSISYAKRLLGKTYLLCLKDHPQTIVAAFTLSNDSIRMTNKLNDESKTLFLRNTNLENKRLRRFPAILIGRLATNKQFAGKVSELPSWILSRQDSDTATKRDVASSLWMLTTVNLPCIIT